MTDVGGGGPLSKRMRICLGSEEALVITQRFIQIYVESLELAG